MAWKYLLKSYSFADTLQDQTEISAKRREQYFNLKMSWMEVIETSTDEHSPTLDNGPVGDENEDADLFSKIRERKKDAVRTDRNTPYYESASEDGPLFAGLHAENSALILGYVQGMSDLCSPILEVMDEEVETFWVFNSHFSRNQLGMQLELRRLELLLKLIDPPLYRHMEQTDSVNMFCCFRWLLICFKPNNRLFDQTIAQNSVLNPRHGAYIFAIQTFTTATTLVGCAAVAISMTVASVMNVNSEKVPWLQVSGDEDSPENIQSTKEFMEELARVRD
ncbi:hypothetical protein BSLG_005613 [Batrachochytrium salamandrivorans]|nr:hypothetical protein BSLG_005613 [Batrachochytrium salamandrivorans]